MRRATVLSGSYRIGDIVVLAPRGSGRARSAQQLGVGVVYEVEALSVIGAYRLRHHEPTKSSLS